jgi:hypothetical protein
LKWSLVSSVLFPLASLKDVYLSPLFCKNKMWMPH